MDKSKSKFGSRKWMVIVFWNVVMIVSIFGTIIFKEVTLPLELIVGITGGLTGGYLGINLYQKSIERRPPTPTTPGH